MTASLIHIPFTYRYWFERLPRGVRLHLPQLPEANFDAATPEAAQNALQDKILEALEARLKTGELPEESVPRAGEGLWTLSPTFAAKALLIEEAQRAGVYPAELARRLCISSQEAQRILKLRHASKFDTIADAFRVIGLKLVISAEPMFPKRQQRSAVRID